ncbi:18 kDa seed maturation protein [Prosopis cineraria]|uniref:18 kDa seed maturation protein n=1 Tax=Prosopis cineraria TaxID=364024 RepID=UPI002410481E|nr:18 kDa seed maturation protein [Prosopis cineraria]
MQKAKQAAESMKEKAANIGASAKSGMEKTKATVQEKKDRMTAHDPTEKEMATERKEERMRQAELDKREARGHNVASKQAATVAPGGHGGNYTTGTGTGAGTTATGAYGHPMAGQQMSAMPGHGTGQPTGGHVVEDVDEVRSHNTNTQYGGNNNAPGYGTTRSGGSYS